MQPRRMRIAEKFALYRDSAIPKDASPGLVEECRRAFYCGALALSGLVSGELSPGETNTPDDLTLMIEIYEELRDFSATFNGQPVI